MSLALVWFIRTHITTTELRQQLGMKDTIKVVKRNRLRWYGHLRKDDDDWVK